MRGRNLGRREVMRLGLAGGAAAALGGCAFLQPATLAEQIEGKGIVIDVHTHIFNADDLSVEGFLSTVLVAGVNERTAKFRSQVARYFGQSAASHLRFSADGISRRLAKRIQQVAINYDTESRRLRRLEEGLPPFDTGAEERDLRAKASEVVVDAFSEELGMGGVARILLNYGLEKLIFERANQERHPLLDYVFRMMWYRHLNAEGLVNTFGRDGAGVDLFVSALVDMEWWLGSAPKTPIPKQIALLERIALLNKGRILPFVPFDPLRQVMEGNALGWVREAVGQRGFAGVKLYPPMGFYPLGNKGVRVWPPFVMENSDGRGDDLFDLDTLGEQLDLALHSLYAWCADNEVPILTHFRNSNASGEQFGERAGPAGWKAVYDYSENGKPRYRNLKVNMGHFGSEKEFVQGEGWSRELAKMMPENPNWFADLSAFDGVLGEEGLGRVQRALQDFYTNADGGRERNVSRLMYASDWIMNAYRRSGPEYLARFEDVIGRFDPGAFPDLKYKFFGLNAVDYLGLRRIPGRTNNRTRLDAYYGSAPIAVWRELVDALPA